MARAWVKCTSPFKQRPASSTLLIDYLLYFHLNLLCNTKLFCSHPTPKITGTIYPRIVNTGTRYELLHGAVTLRRTDVGHASLAPMLSHGNKVCPRHLSTG